MRTKILPLVLPPDLYAELERRARSQERDPIQQARHLIRVALQHETPAERPTETAAAVMAAK